MFTFLLLTHLNISKTSDAKMEGENMEMKTFLKLEFDSLTRLTKMQI